MFCVKSKTFLLIVVSKFYCESKTDSRHSTFKIDGSTCKLRPGPQWIFLWQVLGNEMIEKLDWESIRSSPRDGSNISYGLTKGTLHCWTVHSPCPYPHWSMNLAFLTFWTFLWDTSIMPPRLSCQPKSPFGFIGVTGLDWAVVESWGLWLGNMVWQ